MRTKRCKHCKQMFQPSRPLAVVCSPLCAHQHAQAKRTQLQAKAEREQRKETRQKLEALKPLAKLRAEAQSIFNKWIRWRDRGQPCISCGTHAGMDEANGADAGHYRTRSAAPHLRYDERNVHAQCKRCNRYLAGNQAAMGRGMILRLGIEIVEALEADNEPKNYTRDDLQAIKAEYAGRLKA